MNTRMNTLAAMLMSVVAIADANAEVIEILGTGESVCQKYSEYFRCHNNGFTFGGYKTAAKENALEDSMNTCVEKGGIVSGQPKIISANCEQGSEEIDCYAQATVNCFFR